MRKLLLLTAALMLACLLAAAPGFAHEANAATLYDTVSSAWPAALADTATGVAYEESGGVPTATNGEYRGLFQIGVSACASVNCNYGALFDPYYNAQVAYELYQQSGWAPWTVYPPAAASIAAGGATGVASEASEATDARAGAASATPRPDPQAAAERPVRPATAQEERPAPQRDSTRSAIASQGHPSGCQAWSAWHNGMRWRLC
jgi:hypothetical protein